MGASTLRRYHEAISDAIRDNPPRSNHPVSAHDHDQAIADLNQKYGREILALKAESKLTATVDVTGVEEVVAQLKEAEEMVTASNAHANELANDNANLQAEVADLKKALAKAEKSGRGKGK